MASISQGAVAPSLRPVTGRNGWVDRYFCFAISLVFAAIVVIGFSRTVNQSLFHPAVPRPFLLWIHGAAFSGWIAFYFFQSALVRTHNIPWHRLLGWSGAALGALMVPLGVIIAIIMGRFDATVLHEPDPPFLSIPFYDMVAFGTLVSPALLWRKKPELHRRLLFLATCSLLNAPFGRFDFVFDHALFYPCMDLVILVGLARDLHVNRDVHKVYWYALPALIVGQGVTIYLWRGAPTWWVGLTRTILF